MKRTFGADIGYSSGKNSSSLNIPPSYGDYNILQSNIHSFYSLKKLTNAAYKTYSQ